MPDTYFAETLGTTLLTGTLLERSASGYLVDFDQTTMLCRKAAACLLDPEPGDEVLAAVAAEGKTWILSVLERFDSAATARFTLAEDAVIKASQGELQLHTLKGTEIASSGTIRMSAQRLDLSAEEGNWLVRSLSMIGNSFESVWKDVRQTGSSIRTTCTTWMQYLGDSFRHVKNLDESSAENVRIMASDTLQQHGKFVNTTAVEVVKVDGQEVHLG